MFSDSSPKLGDSDNTLLFKIAQTLGDAGGGESGVTTFNARTGAVVLTLGDVSGVGLPNPLSVYGSGTVYTLGATIAAVDLGTTDPILTINAAGTYRLRARIMVNFVGTTFAANQTVTVRLRRTNNTPGDVANSTTVFQFEVITTARTQTITVIELPEVFYTTANADDTLQIFAGLSALPGAGSVNISETSITAIRTSV